MNNPTLFGNLSNNKKKDSNPIAITIGIRRTRHNQTLDVIYPTIETKVSTELTNLIVGTCKIPQQENTFQVISKSDITTLTQQLSETNESKPLQETLRSLLHIKENPVAYFETDIIIHILYTLDTPIINVEEGYLKLQLLSQRHNKPHDLNLDGLFKTLPNIAWTNKGPILPEELTQERLKYIHTTSPLNVTHVDKFPYLLNYHIPSGVRIASGSQVRLGAYLGEGTTVMPAGYINFNAGTNGNAMVEGRVSAGVFVGKNSDIGGGASIMGTLSGGNETVISIGEQCLLGANAGTGISLGKGCTIEAGLYLTAGMKITLQNEAGNPVDLNQNEVNEGKNIVKAYELSGKDYCLFIKNSRTGTIICKPNKKLIQLNESLHTHN